MVCDFVCPTVKTRQLFDADFTVWMDTIKEGRYEDTNRLFERPTRVEMRITEWNDNNHWDVAEEALRKRR